MEYGNYTGIQFGNKYVKVNRIHCAVPVEEKTKDSENIKNFTF